MLNEHNRTLTESLTALKEAHGRCLEELGSKTQLLETIRSALSTANKEKEELLTAKLNSYAEQRFTRERETELESQVQVLTSQLSEVSRHNQLLMTKVSDLEAEKTSAQQQLSKLHTEAATELMKCAKAPCVPMFSQAVPVPSNVCEVCKTPAFGRMKKCQRCVAVAHGRCVAGVFCCSACSNVR